jgi:hypothetical protein
MKDHIRASGQDLGLYIGLQKIKVRPDGMDKSMVLQHPLQFTTKLSISTGD